MVFFSLNCAGVGGEGEEGRVQAWMRERGRTNEEEKRKESGNEVEMVREKE